MIGKVKLTKTPDGFELMTYRFLVNALTHFATLLGKNFGKEQNYTIILDFIVHFNMRMTLLVYK